MLETIVALITLASLILYALMGGADFGGGIWDLLARGPRASRQRQIVAHAIAPIWEANHVWLILVIVLLFTAFPKAFAIMMTALHIPLTIMLLGIVARGSAFVFRKYDVKDDQVQRRWSTLFGIASLATPFVQGLCLGALGSGAIQVINGQLTTGFLAGWTGWFALSCGIFALGLFAFLAAVYLSVDAAEDVDVQEDFRRRAFWTEVALAPVAAAVFFTARAGGAPQMYEELTRWWAPLLLLWTSAFAVLALVSLWRRQYRFARVAAIGQVTSILVGWSVAQFPHLIVPHVDIHATAAPEITLRLLLIALALGGLVLLPSLYYLLRVFKAQPIASTEADGHDE